MNLIMHCPECDAGSTVWVTQEDVELVRVGCSHVDDLDPAFRELCWGVADERALDLYEDAMERRYDVWGDR